MAAVGRRPLLRKAGIQRLRWNDLRHTFGSRLAQAGVPLQDIMVLMGHSNFQVTLRYAHLAPSNLRDAVKALDAVPDPSKSASGSTHGSTHGVRKGVFVPEKTLYTGTQ